MDINSKREEVKGFTTADLININNNFKTIWQGLFGNTNFTDEKKSTYGKINKVDNSVNNVNKSLEGVSGNIENHEKSYHFSGNYSDLQGVPTNFEPSSKDLKLGVVNILKQGRTVMLDGRFNPSVAFTGNSTLMNLPAEIRPTIQRNIILYCSNTKMYTAYVYPNGDLIMNSRTDTINTTDIIVFNNIYFI